MHKKNLNWYKRVANVSPFVKVLYFAILLWSLVISQLIQFMLRIILKFIIEHLCCPAQLYVLQYKQGTFPGLNEMLDARFSNSTVWSQIHYIQESMCVAVLYFQCMFGTVSLNFPSRRYFQLPRQCTLIRS